MRMLSRAMGQVAEGNLDVRAPVTSNDEIGEVTGRFNTMVEGLRERERIRETFGRYVDESVATTILRAPGRGASGEIGEATILFTDIAGFTTIAEYLAPAELVGGAERVSRDGAGADPRHGGVVNTFIGDGLFACFNMPLACDDHACAAVRAAIDIQRAVGSRTFGDQGVALATRIGISTGPVIGGSIGAGQRMSYTLLGDTVNLAARLEELNKHHGTRILVSQSTRDACGELFAFDVAGHACRCADAARPIAIFSVDPNRQGNASMNASGLSPEQVKLQARVRELAAGPGRQARRRGRPHRAISLGQCRAAEGREAARHDDPARSMAARARTGSTPCWRSRRCRRPARSPAASPSRPTWARSAR